MTLADAPSAELLALLRREGQERELVDSAIAPELTARLEAAASGALALPDGLPIVVTKDRLQEVLLCERHRVEQMRSREREASPEMIRGQFVDLLFTLVVTGLAIGEDPVSEVLAADSVAHEPSLAKGWERLDQRARREMGDEIAAAAAHFANWPRLPPNAFPRIQESMRVELASGRIVLLGRADLVLGREPPRDR